MRFSLKQLHDKIFLVTFDDYYDIAIHFLRAQEYYESNSERFKGKQFEILDYIEWYAKGNDYKFSYADDFVGFNVPGEVMDAIYVDYKWADNFNKYDRVMESVVSTIHSIIGNTSNYYLIGAKEGDEDTVDHELAHAFWYVDSEYKELQQKNIDALSDDLITDVKEELRNCKYTEEVLDDEFQAYFSTGLDDPLKKLVGRSEKKIIKPFVGTFKEFKKRILK